MSDYIASTPFVRAAETTSPALPSAIARPLIAMAALSGLAGDALLRGGPSGVAFPIWVTLVALGLTSLVGRANRSVAVEARWSLAVAVVFATGLAWRDSDILQLLDVLASAAAIGFAALTIAEPHAGLLAPRLRDTLIAALTVMRRTATGILPLALQEFFPSETRRETVGRARPIARAAIIAIVLLLIFGSLLRSADPIFASLVALPDVDIGTMISHVIVIGALAWIVGGWACGALEQSAERRPAHHFPVALGQLELTTALCTLNVLFFIFVLAQLGWFFGGETFLRDRTGLTAAEYARQGFFQTVGVVTLVLPILLITRAAIADDPPLVRRHSLLALPNVALLLAMIVSAVLRMQLYVRYFGLSVARFDTLVLMAWLALVLLWLAATVLRDRGRPFVAGTVVSGLAVLALLNIASPDAVVARVNIARAASPGTNGALALDLRHLAWLGGDASEIVVSTLLATPTVGDPVAEGDGERCVATRRMLTYWGPGSSRAQHRRESNAWRAWNAGESNALDVVGRNSARLRSVMHESCARARTGATEK